jgi:hypothetical protein
MRCSRDAIPDRSTSRQSSTPTIQDRPAGDEYLTTASRARREDVQDVVATALCQDTVATVGKRERYAVNTARFAT